MVKAAKINIITPLQAWDAQTGDRHYNPYKIVNKTFTDTDGKQVTLKSYLVSFNTDFWFGIRPILAAGNSLDDPMEAVVADVPKMKARS